MTAQNGIVGKYIIKKADGSPIDPQACYFVLRLDTDHAARRAAKQYARSTKNEELADALDACVDEIERRPCGCREAACPHEPMFDPVWRYGEVR